MNLENDAPRSVSINCGVLDMRETTEQTVSAIQHVNTGTVLVSAETRPLMMMFTINMGNVVEAPKEVGLKVVHSKEIMGRDAFNCEGHPLLVLNSGNIILEPDVAAEDLDVSWFGIINSGSILYPKHLAGTIMDKLMHNPGSNASYRSSARLVIGDVVLDEVYLASMDSDTDMVVTGNLKMVQEVSNDLIDQKISTFHVRGKVLCCEKNVSMLGSKFDPRAGTPKTIVIPEGFELAERELSLNSRNIKTWRGRSICAIGNITLNTDINPDTLDRAIRDLICTGTILCPEKLSDVLLNKCDTLNTKVIFYDGTLWIVDTTLTLLKSRFDFLQGTATLYNTGVVTIADDVDSQCLYDHLAGVYNWGVVNCNTDQMGAVDAKMVVNEGVVVDVTAAESSGNEGTEPQHDVSEGDKRHINAGYCKI